MVRGYLSFTPFKLRDLHPLPVRRRHVFFIHGFDARSGVRFPAFFKRELDRHTTRFGVMPRAVSEVRMGADGLSRIWTVSAPGGRRRRRGPVSDPDLERHHPFGSGAVPVAEAGAARAQRPGGDRAGTDRQDVPIFGLPYTLLTAFPFFVVFVAPYPAISVGIAIYAAVSHFPIVQPAWAALPLALAALASTVLRQKGARAPVLLAHPEHPHLLLATCERSTTGLRGACRGLRGTDPDRDGELARAPRGCPRRGHDHRTFPRRHDGGRGCGTGPDAARRRHPGASQSGAGHAGLRDALRRAAAAEPNGIRNDIAALVYSRHLVWCDYQAPQDWLNCYGFNPIFDIGLERPAFLAYNPIIRSAGVKDRIPEADYKRLRLKPFHMHFQFLKANFRPGEYDFFEMVLGRQSLLDRALRPLCRRPATPPHGG